MAGSLKYHLYIQNIPERIIHIDQNLDPQSSLMLGFWLNNCFIFL